jgi:hypothetical protein
MSIKSDYDFSGWATRNDITCSDGLTIRQDAFKDCDGLEVPLVYMHDHKDVDNVLGHALLENREDGVYCYGKFNEDTDNGMKAKALVAHGDITSLSIYANQLVKRGKDVLHGAIREVSLVLAGANPGATIDFPVLQHSDGTYEDVEDEAIISFQQPFRLSYEMNELAHAMEEEEDEDEYDEPEDDDEEEDDEPTVDDVMETLDEDQQQLLEGMMALAYEQGVEDASGEGDEDEESEDGDDEVEQSDFYEEGDTIMHKNVFEREDDYSVLQHGMDAETATAILEDSVNNGQSLRSTSLAHGIEDIDWLFPEAKMASPTPEWIKRDTGWVSGVLNGVHHTPYSRIKSRFADIREDEARARGYIKDEYKKEETFSLLKRTTTPQTIYKKQKLDRDDIIDITDFDVVAWIKSEMRGQLDEELARAILVGDGRLPSDDDHISEEHIRPIWKDADLFAVKVTITMKAGATDDDKARAFLRANLKARKYYKGSGSPTMFTTDSLLSDVLLLEDGIGRTLYETDTVVATKCRVSSIVPVEIMEGLTDEDQGDLAAIVVNMTDYNVGADKGGAVAMFEDFDIDYNQNKYLIETRCSGALVKPYSALVFSFKQGSGSNTVISFSGDGMAEFTIKDDDNAQG